ncbi:hybrid sensor histidine kinase/response regulator [Actomonas aquatica]|uniref:histidine kinase n=1 Tax=Actomonas aquatica TaxID=2866162 RepID=A0ABZ1C4J7_9BACT|nr:ATP-binding protein [Opitutus sp. WL0086]WRQ86168.1 ATP-binding protein [Opitutus sp. WL0086]
MIDWRHMAELATAQQDFGWFCVFLAWGAMVTLVVMRGSWRKGDRAVWWWWGLTAVGAMGGAMGEGVMQVWPPASIHAERVGWDWWLSGMVLLQGMALIPWVRKAGARRSLVVGWAGLGVLLWVMRGSAPTLLRGGGLMWAATTAWLAVRGVRAERDGRFDARWVEGAVGLVVLVVGLSSTGWLAEVTHQQRRWTDLSFLGLPAVLSQAVLAGAVLWALRPGKVLWPRGLGTDATREVWVHFVVLGGWLGMGGAIAWWTGSAAREAFEETMLARAGAASVVVDRDRVQRLLGPEFQLTDFKNMSQSSGRLNALATVSTLPEEGAEIADQLARVEAVNPGVYWAHLVSLREGYMVSSVISSRLAVARDEVSLMRPVQRADWWHWVEREGFFEGPEIGPWGELVRAYAPLVHEEAGMLGWVVLDFGVRDWLAAQAQARAQTFALVAAGAVVILLVLGGRLQGAERRAMREQAAVAQASDRAKTAFLAKVSHELRTPVQSILGYGELLDGEATEASTRRWTNAIRSQGQLLVRLVNDLIDLSALQSGAFRLVEKPERWVAVVTGVVDSLRNRARAKGLELVVEAEAGLPEWVMVDDDRLRQVVLNLVNNAVKFTDRGRVTVRLRQGRAFAREEGLCMDVIDTGPGIAEQDQARLFRPFVRLDPAGGQAGAGLGLSLSRAICEGMGGSLTLRSDGVSGCVFTARLPLVVTAEAQGDDEREEVIVLTGRRVLVADDNTLVRELFVTGLRQAGAWCDIATDGLEALEMCERVRYDAVIIDVDMPWMDGLSVARKLRGGDGGPGRIIAVSGESRGDGKRAVEAGVVDAFMLKPVKLGRLLGTVAGVTPDSGAPWPQRGGDLILLRKLRAMFEVESLRLAAEMREARSGGDHRRLYSTVHYIKNSADAAGYQELSLLCQQLQQTLEASGQGSGGVVDELITAVLESLSQPAERGKPS